jgi:Tol biopolymer transport system component
MTTSSRKHQAMQIRTKSLALMCLLLAPLSACNTGFPNKLMCPGKIAFEKLDGNTPLINPKISIHLMDADGSNETTLTDAHLGSETVFSPRRAETYNTSSDLAPIWSPDGRQIVFESARDKNFELYLMNADGSAQRNLTNHQEADWGPIWSPDGKQIAFASQRDSSRLLSGELYVMNADGSNPRKLSNIEQFNILKYRNRGLLPVGWTPDGNRIFFITIDPDRPKDEQGSLYVVNIDGSNQIKVIEGISRFNLSSGGFHMEGFSPETSVSLSPDAKKAVFNTEDGIYIANTDGSDKRRLKEEGLNPVWSPDGKRIAFLKQGLETSGILIGTSQLFTINADGSGESNATNTRNAQLYAAWSPDAKQILFTLGTGWSISVANVNEVSGQLTSETLFKQLESRSPRWQSVSCEAPIP